MDRRESQRFARSTPSTRITISKAKTAAKDFGTLLATLPNNILAISTREIKIWFEPHVNM
jgi:hypothetical protein